VRQARCEETRREVRCAVGESEKGRGSRQRTRLQARLHLAMLARPARWRHSQLNQHLERPEPNWPPDRIIRVDRESLGDAIARDTG
jgi:hypothetical protein